MTVRVLHVLPHRGGGAETYIDMLERLPGISHERAYLSSGRSPASAASSVPTRWPRVAVRARRSDIIHAHGDVASVIALPLLSSRPAVVTTHGLHMLRRLGGRCRTEFTRALAAVASASDAMICLSTGEREDLVHRVRQRDVQKLHVVYNGIDAPVALAERDRNEIRESLGVPAGAALGLFVGQLESRKAPLLAAGAAIRAHAAGAQFVLAVVGGGPLEAALGSLQGDAVRVLGHRSDVQRLLSAADVFVQPSEREGMSFALLEAMSHGLCIVASDSSSNPEALGGCGVLFPSGDEQALTAALIRLTADSVRRVALGALARDRASSHFSPEGFLAGTKTIYEQALANVTAPGRGAVGALA